MFTGYRLQAPEIFGIMIRYQKGESTMRKDRSKTPERIERKISAATSISMCALTVVA